MYLSTWHSPDPHVSPPLYFIFARKKLNKRPPRPEVVAAHADHVQLLSAPLAIEELHGVVASRARVLGQADGVDPLLVG